MLFNIFDNQNSFYRELFESFDDFEDFLEGRLTFDLRSRPFGSFPALNVEENSVQVRVKIAAPGVKKEDLDLNIHGNVLTLSGERSNGCKDEKCNIYRKERFSGKFKRVVTLPDTIDPENVTAQYENGIVSVNFEKSEQKKLKKITIQD